MLKNQIMVVGFGSR